MKQFLILILGILLMSSCEISKPYQTKSLKLRQLVKTDRVETSERGRFFLVAGSYSKKETEVTKVKMFANVDGSYRLIEANLDQIRIHIDDKVTNPYVKVIMNDGSIVSNDTECIDYMNWRYASVHIYCSEELLPEKLLPINL